MQKLWLQDVIVCLLGFFAVLAYLPYLGLGFYSSQANVGYQAVLAKVLIETSTFSGFGHPPLAIMLIAASFLIGGYHEFPVRLLFACFFLVGGFFTYRLGRIMHSGSVGVVAAFLYFFSPILVPGIFWYWCDILLMVFVVASVYFFCIYSRFQKDRYVLLSGLFAGLAILAKEAALLLAPVYLYAFKRDKNCLKLLFIMAFFTLLWVGVYAVLDPYTSRFFLMHNLNNLFVNEVGRAPVSAVEILLKFAKYLDPSILALAAVGVGWYYRMVRGRFLMVFLVPAVFLTVFSVSQTRHIRYYLPAVPFILLFASIALVKFFKFASKHKLYLFFTAFLTLGLFFSYATAFYGALAKQKADLDGSLGPKLILFVLTQTDPAASFVVFDRGDANWLSFYTDRTVAYFPVRAPLESRYSLLQRVRPDYLVLRIPDANDMYVSNCNTATIVSGKQYNYSISGCAWP